MFGFIKKCFFTAITFFSYNVLNVSSLECVSMNNQECKIRSANEPMFCQARSSGGVQGVRTLAPF